MFLKFNSEKLFKPHEMSIIRSFKDSLNGELLTAVDDQISAIRVVQRLSKGCDVNCYSRKWLFGRPGKLRCAPINLSVLELLAASFWSSKTSKYPYAAVWFIEGRFFSIEFDGRSNFRNLRPEYCKLSEEFEELQSGEIENQE